MQSTPKDYQQLATQTVEILTEYLANSQNGSVKVLEQKPAEELGKLLQLNQLIKEGGLDTSKLKSFLKNYLENTQHMHLSLIHI